MTVHSMTVHSMTVHGWLLYTHSYVCGKIIAYQYGSPDAFAVHGRPPNPTIDSNYVDGISLTHGSTPRKHIWTFVGSLDEAGAYVDSIAVHVLTGIEQAVPHLLQHS